MSAAALPNRSMHGDKTTAGALALAMHALFFVLLVFGVSWQKQAETPVMADLWSNLPPLQKPAAAPLPDPEPAPPKPAPKVVVPPPPKVEPKPAVKPDIALKKKAEEKKKEPPKVEPKKDDRAEKARAAKEAEAKRKFEEDKKREMDLIRAEKEADAKAAEARAARTAQDKLVGEYIERIRNKIRGLIVEPPGMQGAPEAEFDVVLIPGGDVLNAKLRRSSGVPAYDAAVERAIMKAQPLPLPPDPSLFNRFRELRLVIRPK